MPFDPSNSSMFDGATSVGNAPVSGHYAPRQNDVMMQALTAQRNQATLAYLMQNDPRAQLAANVASGFLGGQNQAAWMQANGQATRMAAGMAINGPLAGLMGGSTVDQFVGISTGLAGAGQLRFGGGLNSPGGYMQGGGAMNDVVARQMWSRQQESFYSSSGGAMLHRTGGLSRGELGGVAAYMGQSGAFTGMQAGYLHTIKSKEDYARLQQGAASSGNRQFAADLDQFKGSNFNIPANVLEITKDSSEALNKKISAGAQAIGAIKDILGGRPIAELASRAEALAGVSINSVDGAAAIKSRIDRIQNFAKTNGMSAQGVMANQMNISSQLQGMGLNAEDASIASESVQVATQAAMNSSRARAARLAERGIHTRQFSREQVDAMSVAGLAYNRNETKEIDGALYALEVRTDLTPEQKASIRSGIDGIRNATGSNAMELQANQRSGARALNSTLLNVTGTDASTWSKGAVLSPTAARERAAISMDIEQAKNKNLVGDILRRRGFDKDVVAGGFGAGTSEDVESLSAALADDTRTRVQAALSNGDAKGARSIIASTDGLDSKKKAELMAVIDRQGGSTESSKRFGSALDVSSKLLADNAQLSNATSIQDRTRAIAAEGQNLLASQAFGTGIASDNLLTNLREGLLGGSQITDEQVMQFAAAKGKASSIGSYDKDGVFQMDKDMAANLLRSGGDKLAKAMGLEGSESDRASQLQDKLKSFEGMGNFLKYSSEVGMVRKGSDNKAYFLGSKDASEMRDVLEKERTADMYSALAGEDRAKIQADMAKDPRYAENMAMKFGQNLNSYTNAIMSSGGDFRDNRQFKGIQALIRSGGVTAGQVAASIDNSILSEQDKLSKDPDNAAARSAVRKLQEMKDNIVGGPGADDPSAQIVKVLGQILGYIQDWVGRNI